jgi:sugar lactone lactonase YvrE
MWAQQYTISTYAGGVAPTTPIPGVQAYIGNPQGVAVDRAGNVYFSGLNCVFKLNPAGVLTLAAGNARKGYSGDGGPAVNAQLNSPQGLTVDAAGNLYVAEDNRVRMVSPTGTIITVAGNGSRGYSGDGGVGSSAQISTVFWPPAVNSTGLAVDARGNLYIADSGNNRVRKVSAEAITTVAGTGSRGYSGDGGLATNAQFASPRSSDRRQR